MSRISWIKDLGAALGAAALGAVAVVGAVYVGLPSSYERNIVLAGDPALVPAPTPAQAMPPDCPTLVDAKAPWLLPTSDDGPELVPEAVDEPPMPRSLERRVRFWQRVWGETPVHTYLLVDDRRPWVVHGSVDCTDVYADASLDDDARRQACGQLLGGGRKKIERQLRAAAFSPKLTKEFGDARLARTAWGHVIGIEGKAQDLRAGMDRAAMELGLAERIFASHGVPRAFARLGFVESRWMPRVVSRSGAVGTYQFMPATGREHMRVDDAVDERLDPLRSASAAARYLKGIARGFDDDWALTLTAYNQGPSRMKRVVKALRTRDIGKIADAGDRGSFGFDGQNYYAQMVAVARLTSELRFDPLPRVDRAVVVGAEAPVSKIAACLQRRPEDVLRANPALVEATAQASVPKGYVLAVPRPTITVADATSPVALLSTAETDRR